jgi:hypothetical protein
MDVLHAPQRSQTGPLDKCLIGDLIACVQEGQSRNVMFAGRENSV